MSFLTLFSLLVLLGLPLIQTGFFPRTSFQINCGFFQLSLYNDLVQNIAQRVNGESSLFTLLIVGRIWVWDFYFFL